jgi:putative ABC transport system permease protein
LRTPQLERIPLLDGGMDTLLQNIRVGVRSLRRTPGFALVAVLILAVGIGLSTAVFTVADAVLLRRLPVHDQDRLVVLWGVARDHAFDYPLSLDDGREFARQTRTLQQAALFLYNGSVPLPIRDGDRVTRLRRALVSGAFFDVLGTHAALGRGLNPADDVRGAAPVLVLSYAVWQQRFHADPHVLGRRIVMFGDSTAYTIVGVMPQGLDYPKGTDYWAPVVPSMSAAALSRMAFYVIGSLSPGATSAGAANELTAFFGRAEAASGLRQLRGVASRWPRLVIGDFRPALIACAAAAGLLLVMTCINIATLLLVRGFARVREIAVRSALGASRRRIVAQLLTEAALLAAAGGSLGVVVAAGAVRSFVALAPAGVPRLDEIHLNGTALTGALAMTALAVMLFAFAPAMLASGIQWQRALRADTRHSANRRSRLATEALVAGQLALALLVLAAAGVIVRSLIRLERADLALEPSHLLIGELALRSDLYADADRQRGLLERLVPRLEAIAGVRAVSPVVTVPFSGGGWDGKPAAEGQSADDAADNPMLDMEVVTPDYFAALGMSVLRGRGFTDQDREGAPAAVVVSQAAAQHYWPGRDPIGKRLMFGPNLDQPITVVGVVPDTRYRDLRDARPSIYFPLRQSIFPFAPTMLAIRTVGPPAALAATIRRVIGETEPGVALASVAPFETFLAGPLAQPRLNALLLAVFAAAAVALAAIGLFGVMATMVRQRTLELGIRLALGAAPRDLWRMVMRRGLAIGTAGMVLGLLGAILANRLLVALLYGVAATDGVTLAAAAAFLLGVAALASAIPARTSTRVDPVLALRADE